MQWERCMNVEYIKVFFKNVCYTFLNCPREGFIDEYCSIDLHNLICFPKYLQKKNHNFCFPFPFFAHHTSNLLPFLNFSLLYHSSSSLFSSSLEMLPEFLWNIIHPRAPNSKLKTFIFIHFVHFWKFSSLARAINVHRSVDGIIIHS